jgi:hypothetical protein
MSSSFILHYKENIIAHYREQKDMADAALARTEDAALFKVLGDSPDDHTNSMAILVKHIAGNLRSRWSNFLTSDGEKPDRQRECEFIEESADTRQTLLARWEEGWRILFDTLESLSEEDMQGAVTIRGEPHSVLQAIQRNLLHTAHHVGQIDLLATALK